MLNVSLAPRSCDQLIIWCVPMPRFPFAFGEMTFSFADDVEPTLIEKFASELSSSVCPPLSNAVTFTRAFTDIGAGELNTQLRAEPVTPVQPDIGFHVVPPSI